MTTNSKQSVSGRVVVEEGQVNLTDEPKKGIGSMNGWWERLFKLGLCLLPVMFTITAWTHKELWAANSRLTTLESWKEQGGRFTQEDWFTHQRWIMTNIDHLQKEIDSKPPIEMLKRLDSMEALIRDLGLKIDRHLEVHGNGNKRG